MKGYRRDPERAEVRVLRRNVPLAGARVLDIGCGDGRLTRRIAGVARAVVAIDPNAALIARAKLLTPASLRETVRYRTGAPSTCDSPTRVLRLRCFPGLFDEYRARAWFMPWYRSMQRSPRTVLSPISGPTV